MKIKVIHAWGWFTRLIRPYAMKNRHLTNQLLKIPEQTFTNGDPQVKIVSPIDPELSRTVVVSTKLDTKIAQFARASDVEVFLSPLASVLDGFMLGGLPFFTLVPSRRVGSARESIYRSSDEFKQVLLLDHGHSSLSIDLSMLVTF
ncbi:dynamin-like protein ARC5 [Rutidosis leptorrhynchoides]|uniref:dynamin-like protein ARC5 n=1 Tax=Rutidosis leptorrhynchoides TaxID=125765 RepID=UPI003A994FEE